MFRTGYDYSIIKKRKIYEKIHFRNSNSHLCYPILESLTEIIQVALEIPKGLLSCHVIKINSELQDLQNENEPINTSCIGFEVPNETYDDFEDCKHKIGFRK